MARATTPTATGSLSVANRTPSTPSAHMPVQRKTPDPSTPGHRRVCSLPHTPGTSPLTACSSSASAFAVVKVHTAKCSECDQRNRDVMRRCPGCTFQVCKPCQEKREKSGRSLAHGNMVSPHGATPGVGGGSVVRRRPVGVMKSFGEQREGSAVGQEAEGRSEIEGVRGKRCAPNPAAKPKSKSKARMRALTPSDDSSDDDFALDPASPTAHKRRRTALTLSSPGANGDISLTSDRPSSLPSFIDEVEVAAKPRVGDSVSAGRPFHEMSTDELLAHYDVNTWTNPYKAHLLSRHEPVVTNPTIEIPEIVKRGFKPRPSAGEIQKRIQKRVREKMGLAAAAEAKDGDA
ncbi:uncharacterized protein EKO05_0010621 [Ascochyta rabiei]|uniref:Uncharacterized protein n=1 Tax=Didymella rabiei TaxID=5454 RepID=A0A162ZKQ9_DIDRA|nr:uncharacterized protein EKO05_0010621 [Ascochyta rabiei]KZM20661.1 hypothetical protein ST47_g8204 [Ascochyta rabiei]UPX20388.1 hypothetical protein EKO05_0010621 [Ascochyta rabiei]